MEMDATWGTEDKAMSCSQRETAPVWTSDI